MKGLSIIRYTHTYISKYYTLGLLSILSPRRRVVVNRVFDTLGLVMDDYFDLSSIIFLFFLDPLSTGCVLVDDMNKRF